MRIIYLSQYFPPEAGATQSRAEDFSIALAEAGHEVVVICEIPNHPSGRVPAAYRGRLVRRERHRGVEVIHVWVWTSTRKTFATRLALYASFVISAVLASFTVRGPIDTVYATSPPLPVGGAALVIRWLRRARLVFEVRDLWPEVAIALGELRHPLAVRAARWLERRCYRRAAAIVTVTQRIAETVRRGGVPPGKVFVVPNGANLSRFQPRHADGLGLRRSWQLEGRFVVLYAGLHGLAYDFDSLLDAAARLADESDITFLLVGEGPRKEDIAAKVHARELNNVALHDEVPRDQMPALYSLADVTVIPLRRAVLFQDPVPLKLLEAWACACPCIVAAEGLLAGLVERAGGGIVVAPEQGNRLAEGILRMRRLPGIEMGESGRRFVHREGYSREARYGDIDAIVRGRAMPDR
jgi:glycosyltransferase involved in cell wall biosynthesis